MRRTWQDMVKAIGLTPMFDYYRQRWAEFPQPDQAQLDQPFLNEEDIARYPEWLQFDAELTGLCRRVSAMIDADRELKTAALFLHWALFLERPFYLTEYFTALDAERLGDMRGMFGMCVLLREVPRTLADLRRRDHPNPRDVTDNFHQVLKYAKPYHEKTGRWGLRNACWCALCVTPYLNTAHHLRFAPARLSLDFTFYRHRESGDLLCLAGGGMPLRHDGLLPVDHKTGDYVTTWSRDGDIIRAHRVSASGFVYPEAERFDVSGYEVAVKQGDALLGFHIPRGPGYDVDTCLRSFEAALKLFGETYPEVEHKGFYCDSWLFSPQLPLMMTARDSGIITIQQQTFMLPCHSDKEAFATFLYRLDSLPQPERLPRDSRLQSLVRDHLMAGRHLTVGSAVLPIADWRRFGETPWYREEELRYFAGIARDGEAMGKQ